MTVPGWLFDELADRRRDIEDLEAKLKAWDGLLDGAEEVNLRELPLDTLTWTFPAPPGQAESADDGDAAEFARRWARIQREQGNGKP